MRGSKVLHKISSSPQFDVDASSSASHVSPSAHHHALSQSGHQQQGLSAFDQALLKADNKRQNRARLPEVMPVRPGQDNLEASGEGGNGQYAISRKGAAIIDRLRRTFGDSIFTPQLDSTVLDLEAASRRRIEKSIASSVKAKKEQRKKEKRSEGLAFSVLGAPSPGVDDDEENDPSMASVIRGAQRNPELDAVEKQLAKSQKKLQRLLDLDGSSNDQQQSMGLSPTKSASTTMTPTRHQFAPYALTPEPTKTMMMKNGGAPSPSSALQLSSSAGKSPFLTPNQRSGAGALISSSSAGAINHHQAPSALKRVAIQAKTPGPLITPVKSGKPVPFNSPERKPVVSMSRGPPRRLKKIEPTPQQVRLQQEQLHERKHQLKKLQVLEDQMHKIGQIMLMEEEEKARLAGASTAQRTTNTIVDEWKDYCARHPETEDDRDTSMRARAERRYNRSTNLTQEQYEKLIALSDSLGKTKKWRVPKNAKAEVFKDPRMGCFPLKELPAESVVTEHDSRQIKGTTWILTEEGWIATQLTFDAGIIQIQLVPEAEKCDATVREFMLETLDRVEDNISLAMDQCPIDRMKSEQDIKDLQNASMVRRQEIRDLPAGHFSFIKQTWKTMQEASRFQHLMTGGGGESDEEEEDDDHPGAEGNNEGA